LPARQSTSPGASKSWNCSLLLAETFECGRAAVAGGDDRLPLLVADHRPGRVAVHDVRLHREGHGHRPIGVDLLASVLDELVTHVYVRR